VTTSFEDIEISVAIKYIYLALSEYWLLYEDIIDYYYVRHKTVPTYQNKESFFSECELKYLFDSSFDL
jgi:hypothetical protein